MRQKSWIAALLSVLLSVCFSFLGLFGALELTFFNSGYLIDCMDQTGYIGEIANVAQITCQGYVTSAGLNTVALEGYLDPADIRSEVHRGVAERYRGSSASFYQPHFGDFAGNIRSSLSPEELAVESEDSLARFHLLQDLCETAFREVTRPPFDAALSCVLQYRAYRLWTYLVLFILGVSIYLVLRRAVPDPQILGRRMMQALGGGGLALAALGALLRWALPFASWMPAENLSHPLFCMWWSGFAMTTAVAGLLMLCVGLVWTFWQGTHPARKPGGAEDSGGPLSGAGSFAGGDRMQAPDAGMQTPGAGRMIDLSRALVGSAPSAGAAGAANAPDLSELPDDSGCFPGL